MKKIKAFSAIPRKKRLFNLTPVEAGSQSVYALAYLLAFNGRSWAWHDVGRCRGTLRRSGSRCAAEKIRKWRNKQATMKSNNGLRRYVPSMLLFLLFEAVAITLWRTKDNLFYLLNFSYIGTCLGLGTALFTAGKRYARHFVQLAVGSYMLLYLGVIARENMQIEGFWYYLFLGIFEAATIHYAVAKFLDRCFLDAAGAAMPVGRLWFWTFCPTSSRRNRERKS